MQTVVSSANIRKLFLIPVGLPGMGKTTLAYTLQQAFTKINHSQQQQSKPNIIFKRISYDHILEEHQQKYQAKHPSTPFHEIIDIVRADADKEYLEVIDSNCKIQSDAQEMIFMDRNNTPDVWNDITGVIKSNDNTFQSDQNFQNQNETILILPNQVPVPKLNELYKCQNPITPQLIYNCIKRIFGRHSHSCLSSENKPKVVEVLLKFTKLYDNIDFENKDSLKGQFNHVLHLDFLSNSQQNISSLSTDTFNALVDGYNKTPKNFVPPSDETINMVLRYIEKQIENDIFTQNQQRNNRNQVDAQNAFVDQEDQVLILQQRIADSLILQTQSELNLQISSQIKLHKYL
ncbi:UNKNOWN [Stylonychia lemnae]|uniref:Uncharacterized protein n=1 Tax=Stylonychia lemnae TaxID=5949 RepID=A0A078ATX2_STYLE|nr:UNKNOWN [Stylonychia lemnae]|eukprot:CDW84692.1 UNKNOWN [Stylonychia lemnae]